MALTTRAGRPYSAVRGHHVSLTTGRRWRVAGRNTADELGIDPKTAAKIETIKRLRPLSPRQPWGIFFVKFQPGRLPVIALRRILSQVALKKRAPR
jgi:hypothetical protein